MVDALSGNMDFAEYGSSLIWPEQIPKADWKKKGGFGTHELASGPAGH